MALALRFRQPMLRAMRRLLKITALLVAGVVGLVGWGYHNARADPVVRRVTLHLPGLPAGTPPVRVVLLSDIHIGAAAMDAGRLTRIVRQVTALSPELIVIAGDFVFGHDPAAAVPMAAALEKPLSDLHATYGVVAVMGNHDHWTAPNHIRAALRRAHVAVIENNAVARGPLAIGGADDASSGHADVSATVAALARTPGAPLMVTHSPDLVPHMPKSVRLVLAGHTHCGQAVLPFFGPPEIVADTKYLCGVVREGPRTVVVTGGLGASGVSLRYNAPPDLWVITLVP